MGRRKKTRGYSTRERLGQVDHRLGSLEAQASSAQERLARIDGILEQVDHRLGSLEANQRQLGTHIWMAAAVVIGCCGLFLSLFAFFGIGGK